MSRVGRVVKGLGALVLLAVLVAGIPWALWHFVGWPLPHHLPSAGQVGRALNRQGIPDQALVDALAVVVWLTWAVLVASVVVEVPAALSGRHAPRLPLAGIFQPVTGRLVAAIVVASLSLAPRPAHGPTPGRFGGISAATIHRPVAAMVLTDSMQKGAALTDDAMQPLSAPITSDATLASDTSTPCATPADSPAAAPPTYVVQRGDTLWGIAEQQLGDPLRWSEIYQLNAGRPQPNGRPLSDPHWIDPGWTLVLPSPPSPTPVTPPAPSVTVPAASVPPTPQTPPPSIPSSPLPTTAVRPPRTPVHPVAPPSAGGTLSHRADPNAEPVRLPSGSVVAGSFAAGVLSAVALGRLRRRHAYRYRPPQPGRDLTPEPLRPTLRHLAHATTPTHHDDPETLGGASVPTAPFDDDERRQRPGLLEIGVRHGAPVTMELTDLSGVTLSGAAADTVARALAAALLVRAGPGAAELLLTDDLAARLLPGLRPDPSVRRARTTDDAARAVEAERIARTRRLQAVDASDAVQFRRQNPENPLPALLVLLDAIPPEAIGRWAALLADAPRLGIAVVLLDDGPAGTAGLTVDATRTVTDADPASLGDALRGVQLYGLQADEAVELLGSVTDANHQGDDDDRRPEAASSIATLRRDRAIDQSSSLAADLAAAWPEPAPGDDADRQLVVEVLGPYRITAFGEPVTTGLRGRAKTLLAWYLLRPEGATIDEAVEALWPDTPPDRVLKQFWYALGDLRSYFRGPADGSLDVLVKVGEHYQPNPAEITCDLWSFQGSLCGAARAGDDDTARRALRQAVDVYSGDLLGGSDYPWIEPVRQDLHRRAVDAHLRLAELEDQAGQPDAAVDTLERVINLDRYAEEPYRRLMAFHAGHGRLDAVTATWQLLQRRLADLDVDVDDATARLYRNLTATDAHTTSPHPLRLSS